MLNNTLSEKVLIRPEPALEENGHSDQKRISAALAALGFKNVRFTLDALRKLYPLCREENTDFTVSLVHEPKEDVLVDFERGDTRSRHFGLAVDYGSTTIVFQLIHMTDGQVIYECRETNGQREFGTDILTRICHGLEGPEQKKQLREVTLETFHRGFKNILEHTAIDPAVCPAMVISGNTSMIHFLLELDAWTVFAAPFAPVTTAPGFFSGRELGLDFPGQVFIMPSASNYIGGDIVSGLLTIDMRKQDNTVAFFDVGTNGELVMGNKNWMVAGAGAAGPALEGYISKYGTIARPGAIDHVTISGPDISCTTIENEKAVGICGSGIIDLVSEMRLNGWIDISGTLNEKASPHVRFVEEAGEIAAVYAEPEESAEGKELYFSQTDINQYIETKAAAHTMVDCLLESVGMEESDISKMYLSGAFCNHANLESAITIGMFPDIERSRYIALKNSSLEGAALLLKQRDKMQDIDYILSTIYCIQFASIPDFMIRMQASKFIPHTDMERYPRVAAHLKEKGIRF